MGGGSWRSGNGVRDLVGVSGDVTDVTGKLADEKEVALSPQGPGGGGVGLCDGAGEGLVVRVDDQLPALDEVLTDLATARSSQSKVEFRDSGSVSRRLKKESG